MAETYNDKTMGKGATLGYELRLQIYLNNFLLPLMLCNILIENKVEIT